MAKQSKKAIDQRKADLITAGYTEEELSRPDILESIENTTAGNWPGVAEGLKKTKEDSLIPLTEAEHIPNEQPEENKVPGVSMIVTMDIDKDVKTLIVDVNKVVIADWKAKYAHLKFTTLEDKANNELIKEGFKTAQKARITVEKRETFLKAPYIAGSKKIGSVAGDYYSLLGEIEDPLKAQIKLMKAAEEAEEERKLAEAEKEGTRRVEVLKEAGIKFDGQFYCIGETISMDYASIKAKTPEDFDKFAILVQNEKKRLDDLAAKELEQLKEQRLQTRGNMLVSIGMITLNDGGAYGTELLPGVTVLKECLTDEADDKFMVLFSSLSGRIADAKKKIEDDKDKKAKERTVNMRSKLIIAAGLLKVDWVPGTTQTGFHFKNAFTECKLLLPDVESLEDEAFDSKLEEFEKMITDAKAKAVKKEEDDKAAELLAKDRREQLVALGMTSAPKMSCYIFNLPDAATQCSVAYGELTGQSPETWEATINDVTGTITKIKEEQKEFEDKEEKAAKDLLTFQLRQNGLVNLQMVIVNGAFTVKNEFGDIATITIDEVKAIDEDVWPRRLSEMEQSVAAVKRLTAEKRQEAANKLEAAKPQAEKLKDYLMAIISIQAPVIEDPELAVILVTFEEVLTAAMGEASAAIDRKINAAQPVAA